MATFEVWKTENIYYATGGLSNSNFLSLWNGIFSAMLPGDTLHFNGYTDFITTGELRISKDATLAGDPGARIRVNNSTGTYYPIRSTCNRVILDGLTFSGLGATDNRDMFGTYQLVNLDSPNFTRVHNCIFEHHHQYLLQVSDCPDYAVDFNTFRFGQNGFATYGSGNKGLVENNLFHDCSQGPIKLRGDNGSIIRKNIVRLEYTYWRDFLHAKTPGVDGRGVWGTSSTGCQGIYFGVTDPQPNFNVEVYENQISDASIHGTVNIIDVVDGTTRPSPRESYGCWFPLDTGTIKSQDNHFYKNTVNGAYYAVNIANYATRIPYPLTVYSNNVFTNYIERNTRIDPSSRFTLNYISPSNIPALVNDASIPNGGSMGALSGSTVRVLVPVTTP